MRGALPSTPVLAADRQLGMQDASKRRRICDKRRLRLLRAQRDRDLPIAGTATGWSIAACVAWLRYSLAPGGCMPPSHCGSTEGVAWRHRERRQQPSWNPILLWLLIRGGDSCARRQDQPPDGSADDPDACSQSQPGRPEGDPADHRPRDRRGCGRVRPLSSEESPGGVSAKQPRCPIPSVRRLRPHTPRLIDLRHAAVTGMPVGRKMSAATILGGEDGGA